MFNHDLFEQFMAENRWITEFYPNFSIDRMELRPGVEKRSVAQRFVESLFPRKLATRLDAEFMESTRRFWRGKFPNATPEVYEVSLRTHKNESRAHPEDRSPVVLSLYRENLRRHGVEHD
jgi:hypothetical protein